MLTFAIYSQVDRIFQNVFRKTSACRKTYICVIILIICSVVGWQWDSNDSCECISQKSYDSGRWNVVDRKTNFNILKYETTACLLPARSFQDIAMSTVLHVYINISDKVMCTSWGNKNEASNPLSTLSGCGSGGRTGVHRQIGGLIPDLHSDSVTFSSSTMCK